MVKLKDKPASSQERVEIVQAPWGPVLTHGAFILTIALVIARALVSETLRDALEVTPGAGAMPRGAGAGTSLVLDMICWIPALLVLVRRVIEKDYVLRVRVSHVLLAAFGILAVLSTSWSSDRYAALVTSAHLITAAILLWSTTQLVRSWLRLRLIAGICFGLLLAYLAQGLIYRYVESGDTVKFWNEHKEQILRERGWTQGSFSAQQFERKLLNREMLGFNQSPNSFAAVIVLLSVISAGAAIQRRLDQPNQPWHWVMAATLPAVLLILWLTGTKTAFGTLIIAAGLLVGVKFAGERMRKRPSFAFGLGAGTVALVALLVIAHGLYWQSLPSASMTFRWRYWVAAERLLQQHALLGVGWSNFASHYLTVRLPIAAEEVRDPHNFIVRAFVELGIVGGILVIAWLATLAWELTRPVVPPAAAKASRQARRAIGTILIAVALGVVINAIAAIDFAQESAFVLLETFRRVLFFGLILAGTLIVAVRSLKEQEAEDRPAPWVLHGMIVALAVFFIHNLVDFSLAEPGPLMLFAMLCGAALGIRTSWTGALRGRTRAITGTSLLSVLWVVAFLGVVLPVVDAEQQNAMANEALRTSDFDRAAALYKNAYDRMPLNAQYASDSARAMMYANDKPGKIQAMLETAAARDPMQVAYHLTRGQFERRLGDAEASRRAYERAMALDPNNVRARIEYADALISFNQRDEALKQIRIALAKNDQLHPDEPKRLTADEESALRKKAVELAGSIGATTQPG